MSSTSVLHERKTVPLCYVCKLNPSVDFNEFEEEDELTFLPMDRVKSGYYFFRIATSFPSTHLRTTPSKRAILFLPRSRLVLNNGNIAVAQKLEGGKGFGSSELFVIRPKTVNRKFLFYYFQSSAFKQEGEASMTGAGGLKRVSPDLLRQHHLPCHDGETQRLIADYLDRETARIDALVAEKEKMLALLEEKRATLISRAATRGLNPNTPLKPSGLDWLGDIPVHWDIKRAKNLFSVRDQRSQAGVEELLTVSHITGVTPRSEKDVYMFQADDKAGYKRRKRSFWSKYGEHS